MTPPVPLKGELSSIIPTKWKMPSRIVRDGISVFNKVLRPKFPLQGDRGCYSVRKLSTGFAIAAFIL